MQVIILENTEQIGSYAAQHIISGVTNGSVKVIGVATGSSPLPIYKALEQHWVPELGALTAFALDEYVGLPSNHPQSYHSVIDRQVTRRFHLNSDHVHVPDGSFTGIDTAGHRYERLIKQAGGIDLQILGIGRNGHIGFNEPTSSLTSRTRVKTLAPRTRQDNARFFPTPEDVPTHCLTQGLGTILEARQILLVAQGIEKATAIAHAIEGPLTSMCPASILQLHPQTTVLLDQDAASYLQLAEYYTFTFTNLPAWQTQSVSSDTPLLLRPD